MADLKVIIKALFEGSDEIDKAKGQIEGLGGAAEETEKVGSKSFGDFQDNVAIAMLGINQAIEVGMKLAEAAQVVYGNTVGKALDIANEVETLSRISGEAPENMSALRVAAEESKVPFDDLYKAMENLNKNGIPPTVENLVAIADEYVNLQDPIDKARLLTENFGTAGDEIAPMLEDIAGGVKAVDNAGLIFTEEDIQSVKDYESAVADLSSEWDGFLSDIGKNLVPVLTGLLTTFRETEHGAGMWDMKYGVQNSEELTAALEGLNGTADNATTATESLGTANFDLVNAQIAAKNAVEELTEAQKKMIAEHEKITTLDNNYKGIIDLAYEYTDILDDIAEQEQIMATSEIGSEKWTEAKGKVEELKGKMTELANQVTLDMFQATIAIGGVTEAELAAYMQMAIDMGVMSEGGAQAAMAAYNNAIETINGYEIDEKTGNVSFDAVAAFVTLDLLQQYQLLDKEQRVFVKTYYGTSGGYDPYENYTGPGTAVGGSVNAGNTYTWQEYGYRGEVFVPSADGFILSRADAERALARALYGGGSAISPEEIGKAVAQAMSGITSSKKGGNVYNLTMPTSNNPADVRTAFELMEAWGA
jgi:hypothetical protein